MRAENAGCGPGGLGTLRAFDCGLGLSPFTSLLLTVNCEKFLKPDGISLVKNLNGITLQVAI